MNELIKMLSNSKKFNSYIEEIEKSKNPVVSLTGLTNVAKTYFTYGTKEYAGKKICIVTYNEIQARNLVKNLEFFTSKVVFIPKKEIVTYDYIAESKELPYERIEALNKLQQNKVDIAVTTIEALMQSMIPKDTLYKCKIDFKVGNSYYLDALKHDLINLGYSRCDLIEGKGQFSLRGGILDIAINEKQGIRIEFWGDEVDSIRYFNISSQRSTEMRKEITLYPAQEYVLENSIEEVVKQIEDIYDEENISQDIEQIKNGGYISKVDKYYNCFYTKTESLLNYISDDFLIFIDEITKIKARAKNIVIDNENIRKMLTEKEKKVPDAITNIIDFENIIGKIEKRKRVYVQEQDIGISEEESFEAKQNEIHFNTREVIYYKSSMETFLEDIVKGINENKTVIVLGGSEESSKKLSLFLLEKEIPHKYLENLNHVLPKKVVIVTKGNLEAGFEYYDSKLLVISSKELLNSDAKRRKKVHNAFSEGEKVIFADLKIGDYVVHKTHGIGQFIGVNTISADGITKDYIKIKYRDADILYIPTNQLDRSRRSRTKTK